jgi:hypothetical protein
MSAQDSGSGLPNGGLRGPQDIIDATNRDPYGNMRPADNGAAQNSYGGAQNSYGANPANSYNSAVEPGSIRPFTASPGGYPTNAGYPNASGGYPGANQGMTAGGGYPGNNGYQNGAPAQGTPPYQYASKHHHHHHQQGQYPPQNLAGDPAGAPAGAVTPGMSGPPDAAYTNHHGGGNTSIGGAAIGVPDRAGKTAVGVSGKAAKEVLKALF